MEKPLENKEQKKYMHVLKIVLNVVFYVFIAFLLIFSIATIAGDKHYKIPNIFGVGVLSVNSDSMEGTNKNSFDTGDLIFVKIANEKRIAEIEVGDIVTFRGNVSGEAEQQLITHRVVDIIDNNGQAIYVTQGDKVASIDPSRVYVKGETSITNNEAVEAHFSDGIVAIYSGKLKGFGNFLAFLSSSVGFIVCIIIPTALLLAYEVIVLVKNLLAVNRQKIVAETASQKDKMREELLEELRKEQEAKAQEENNQEENN